MVLWNRWVLNVDWKLQTCESGDYKQKMWWCKILVLCVILCTSAPHHSHTPVRVSIPCCCFVISDQWQIPWTESTSTTISSGHITLIKSQQRQHGRWDLLDITSEVRLLIATRKPSYRWQTRATLKHAKNCSNSTCLLRCSWHYWPIFIRLAVAASEISEIPRNSLKIQTYGVQGHPRSSILVSMESPCVTSY